MVSPSTKRRAVKECIEEGLGEAAVACRALGLARSSSYRANQVCRESRSMREAIIELSQKHPRYGYRCMTVLLRREGRTVNFKRVQRVRRTQGLQVSKKQRRTKRVGNSTADRQRAMYPNHIWSWDFMFDQTEVPSVV